MNDKSVGVRGACVRDKIKKIESRTLTVTNKKMKNMKIIFKQADCEEEKKLEESIQDILEINQCNQSVSKAQSSHVNGGRSGKKETRTEATQRLRITAIKLI